MNKFFISIGFYFLLVLNFITVQNLENPIILGVFILDLICFPIISKMSKEKIYEMTGVTWLQKKIKNNPIINELTTEE